MNNKYIAYLHSDNRSENTIKSYARYIDEFLRFCDKPEDEIGFADIVDYKDGLNLAPASINLRLSAIKNYFEFLRKAHIIAVNPMSDADMVKDSNPKTKCYVSPADVNKMLDVAYNHRGRAIIALLANTGMRVSEMNSITIQQWEDAKKYKTHCIEIVGKGNKKRSVYINADAERYVDEFLINENRKGRHAKQYLFETLGGKTIGVNTIDTQLKTTARRANLPYANDFSAHWFRSYYISNMLLNGVPASVVRDIAGHSSLETTSRYAKVNDETIKNYMMKGIN